MFEKFKVWKLRKRRQEHLEGFKWAMECFLKERQPLDYIQVLVYDSPKDSSFNDFDKGAHEAIIVLENAIAGSLPLKAFAVENGE